MLYVSKGKPRNPCVREQSCMRCIDRENVRSEILIAHSIEIFSQGIRISMNTISQMWLRADGTQEYRLKKM